MTYLEIVSIFNFTFFQGLQRIKIVLKLYKTPVVFELAANRSNCNGNGETWWVIYIVSIYK